MRLELSGQAIAMPLLKSATISCSAPFQVIPYRDSNTLSLHLSYSSIRSETFRSIAPSCNPLMRQVIEQDYLRSVVMVHTTRTHRYAIPDPRKYIIVCFFIGLWARLYSRARTENVAKAVEPCCQQVLNTSPSLEQSLL